MEKSAFKKDYREFATDHIHTLRLQLDGMQPPAILKLAVTSVPPEGIIQRFLNGTELTAYQGLQYPRRRTSYLLGKLAAKLALAEEGEDLTGLAIHHGILGQPLAADGSRLITVTHCDTLGAAMAYDRRLLAGIDIERISDQARDALLRVTSDQEMNLAVDLRSRIGATAFLTILWTAKEAMSKVLQTGFSAGTELFELKMIEQREHGVVGRFKLFSPFISLSVLRSEYIFTAVLPGKSLAPGEEDLLLAQFRQVLPEQLPHL